MIKMNLPHIYIGGGNPVNKLRDCVIINTAPLLFLLFFVKLDFEIAVDQQTRARDQTFEGVPDSGARWTATPIFGIFLAQFCQITVTCALVATSLLNTCI